MAVASTEYPHGEAGDNQVTMNALAREVEEFVAAAGWDQAPALFALVPTDKLLEMQPELAEQLDSAAPLTPIAQEPLPEGDLADALAGIMWPDAVRGCALVQEILVLPPEAEGDLPDVGADGGDRDDSEPDPERLRTAAAEHPQRTEARLVAAVLRDGPAACVLRLRADGASGQQLPDDAPELIEHPELAPNLVAALRQTFE